MEGDLAPFGGAVDDEYDVANLGGFENRSEDTGFRDELGGGEQSGEFEAAANAAEFSNLAGELVLGFNPDAVGGGSESRDARLAQGRGSVSAQEVEEGIELEDACGSVGEGPGHRSFMLQEGGQRRP
jgi:hypothetical protein